jgi:UDP-3-O-[3-hydroxymyristoyl] N-acetylglucosamine deacetylase
MEAGTQSGFTPQFFASEPLASRSRSTLAATVTRSGIGLHTGTVTQVTLRPALAGKGRYFVRVDLPDSPQILAHVASVRPALLSTELVNGEASVRTVEHLLASLAGLGVDDVCIEVDGSELPLLDGSARDWVAAIAQAGLVPQSEPSVVRSSNSIPEPIFVRQGDAFVAAIPAPELRFTYGIDFDLVAIGNQWHSWNPAQDSFAETIAPARTFGLAHQIAQLRASGLIKGGSLDNALVCGADGWINPPLRFSNEPVRHKLLDLIGDLSLLGSFPTAHFLAYKASHSLHTQLVEKLMSVA